MSGKFPDVYTKKHNDFHMPSLNLADFKLKDGWLMIWRPAGPKEMKKGGIVRPDGEVVEYPYLPNCAVVIRAGKGCVVEKGDYIFWPYQNMDVGTATPQPLVPVHTDTPPTILMMCEENVIAWTKGSTISISGLDMSAKIEQLQ